MKLEGPEGEHKVIRRKWENQNFSLLSAVYISFLKMMAFLGIRVSISSFHRGESLLFLISYIRCRAWFAAALKASGVRVWLSAPTAPASGLVSYTCAGTGASSELSWATVWRLAHWRLQRSELKNYSRFHFPALCAFRCL